MLRKQLTAISLAITLTLGYSGAVYADTLSTSTVVMENCGAYLFEWRPVGYDNGKYFAIIVGGTTISESDVILNRGYDYAYTFNTSLPRPWGNVPELVNIDGVWGIPENWSILPEGSQPVTRMVLVTNNKRMTTNERYVDIVRLPGGISTSTLPPEVRKYLINVDGSDAGAYEGTTTNGWNQVDGKWVYISPDGSLVKNAWLDVEEKKYYMDADGFMLADTITPDGVYVNSSGVKTNYFPGWVQSGEYWKYMQKNGSYAASTWIQDTDGKWYYFNIGEKMETDCITPDGYYVDNNGVWDGNASVIGNAKSLGPGEASNVSKQGWEVSGESWKYRLEDGSYVTNAWMQDSDGKWYYFNESSLMVTNQTTPDGYYVDFDGVWANI